MESLRVAEEIKKKNEETDFDMEADRTIGVIEMSPVKKAVEE